MSNQKARKREQSNPKRNKKEINKNMIKSKKWKTIKNSVKSKLILSKYQYNWKTSSYTDQRKNKDTNWQNQESKKGHNYTSTDIKSIRGYR